MRRPGPVVVLPGQLQIGVCTRCGAQPLPNDNLCENCAGKRRRSRNEKLRRERYRSVGVCIRCRTRPTRSDKSEWCAECWAVITAERKQAEADRASRGKCSKCEEPVEPGKKMCSSHLERARKKQNETNYRWRSKGLCHCCGRQPDPGSVLCPACRVKGAARRSNYRLSPEEFEQMNAAQGGKCAICGGTNEGNRRARDGRLYVDHDHETGAVRKLLCHHCNVGLGGFRDDPDLMLAAARYICEHAAPSKLQVVR